MDAPTFGAWLKLRRKALDLTKTALAQQVGCAETTITKIEANTRRPSQQVAERLAAVLAVPATERATYMRLARGIAATLPALPERAVEPLPVLPSGKLPAPLTTLVGRAADVQTLTDQLRDHTTRLLTVTGPPGVGKTRLSIAVAAHIQPDFRDGVQFIALAALRDPARVLDWIAHALGVPEQPGTPTLQRLIATLDQRHMVLLLDNVEQLVLAAPHLAALLVACPLLTLLVTSREPLHVRGERLFRVQPLALPPPGRTPTLAAIARAPAVALFVDIAQAANPAFHLTDDTARDVAAICTRLDGLPLAIEIVAARCATRPLAALHAQLEQRLSLLDAGPRDLPDRQRTLHAALDWSYHLLSTDEQRLFACCGVFVGGWDDAAAQAVCGTDDQAVADRLAALVQKSLIQCHMQPQTEAHFTMLETVHAYACEQRDAHGWTHMAQHQHAHYYLALAERAEPHLKGTAQQLWLERLQQAYSNILASLEWLLQQGRFEQAGRMCVALRRFWWMRGCWHEARGWIARVLTYATALTPLTRAHVQIAAGMIAYTQGDLTVAVVALEAALAIGYDEEDTEIIGTAAHNLGSALLAQGNYTRARTMLEQGLAIDRVSGDLWGVAISLSTLGHLLHMVGNDAQAFPLFAESLALQRGLDDTHSVALTLNNLGEVARCLGNSTAAEQYLAEALQIGRTHTFRRLLPSILNNLGSLALAYGDVTRARDYFGEALTMLSELGDAQELVISLINVAALALETDQPADAVQVIAAAETLRIAYHIRLADSDQATVTALVARVRVGSDAAQFAAAWATGAAPTMVDAASLAQRMLQSLPVSP